jgi:hypothetical protein
MSLTGFLYSLASIPMFASRPFLAAWTTAVLARFGPSIPWIRGSEVIEVLHRSPEWFQSNATIGVLLLFAVLEMLAVKHSEVRHLLSEVDGWLKSAVAVLVSFAVIDAQSEEIFDAIHKSGLGTGVWSSFVGVLVFFAAGLRRLVLEHVADVDDGDDIGLQSALHWAENTWTFVGLLFLVLFPLAAIVLSALTTLGLWLAHRRALRKEEESRVACVRCATRILPHATRCFACDTEVAVPLAVGVFGQPKRKPAADRAQQPFELVSRKRCPACATRLPRRAVRQACPVCRRTTFATRDQFEHYLGVVSARLPRVLLICFVLGAVPLLGVVPGVLYYRLNLVAGLRGYIPPLRGCTTRLLVRVIHFGVIGLQAIPIVGAIALPAMALSTYLIYRRSLVGRADEDLAGLPAAASSTG